MSEPKCPVWVQAVSKRALFFPYDVLSVWMVDIPVLRICAVDAVFWSGIRGLCVGLVGCARKKLHKRALCRFHCCDQRGDAEDLHDAFEIVGQ